MTNALKTQPLAEIQQKDICRLAQSQRNDNNKQADNGTSGSRRDNFKNRHNSFNNQPPSKRPKSGVSG